MTTLIITLDIPHAEHHEHHTLHCTVTHNWRRCVAHKGPLVTQPGHAFRARPIIDATPIPEGHALWDRIKSWRIHPDALALGILAAHYGGGWIYLSGDGAMVTAQTPILIVEVEE